MGTLPTWDFGIKKGKQHNIMTGTLTHEQALAAAQAAAAQGRTDPTAFAAALGGTLRAGDVQRYMSGTGKAPVHWQK
jgi:hypothetical protein